MSNAIRAAVLGLLEATVLNVHDGYVTDSDESAKTISAPLPYVVTYWGTGYPIGERIGITRGRAYEFQINGVGLTNEQAMWALDKAETALDRKLIDVAGRQLRIRRDTDSTFIRRDDTWSRPDGRPLFFGALRFVVARP